MIDVRFLIAGPILFALSSCAMHAEKNSSRPSKPLHPPVSSDAQQVSDHEVKIGQPYQVGGVTYTPADDLTYDEVGYASWYGEELHGNNTANGEVFNAPGVSAAHRTLPMPSYVEVTALDTGRTILVRINDRGPFSNDRLIDLSRGAAEQLGIAGHGAAPVRVRRVNPPEQERVVLRSGGQAAERMEAPDALLNGLRRKLGLAANEARSADSPRLPLKTASVSPTLGYAAIPDAGAKPFAPPKASPAKPGATPKIAAKPISLSATDGDKMMPVPSAKGKYVIQVAAFSSKLRAEQAARRVGGFFIQKGSLWRVRTGPYADKASAQRAIQRVAASGFQGAQIVVND